MVTLEIKLLGPFQTFVGGRPLTDYRSDKVRALLIYLVVEADRPHRRETLAGLLWPDFSQQAAQSNLRKTLYHLRRTIDGPAAGLSDQLLTITRQTIQVNPDGLAVDVFQFKDYLDSIKKHRHHQLHDCDACLEKLSQAAQLYQGEFAAGFSLPDASTFESWLTIQSETFHQEVLGVLEHLAASYEIQGNYKQAVFYAGRQIALEAWRENAYRQLMQALALDGRSPEALAQYENCRRTLWEELAVEPAAETRQLFEQIKNGQLVPKETKTRGQLYHFPTQFSAFIGREAELEEIEGQLVEEECRLLTLIGPGGIGKTRLTIEAARRLADKGHFSDGIYFAPLAAIKERDYLLMALAGQLDLSIYGRSQLQQHLQNYLADKDILLVLDNFEQLAAESGLLSELLQGTQRLKILVSSRESLNIRAEQRLVVGGLKNESAVDLFLQSAAKAWPGYRPAKQDLEAVREICRLVVGIPLAVEMAAGWVKTLDIATIARQIKSNFEILKAAYGDVPERHRSMRIVFEESWKLLRPSEQRSLAQFSIFQGGFSLYAALEITETSVNEVAALLDKSLLEYPGQSRYQLHELLRQFAESKLEEQEQPARETLARKYAQYYLELVRRSEVHLFGKAPQYGMKDIQLELENIRFAWHLAIENDELELVSEGLDGLKMYFRISGRFEEAAHLFTAAVERIAAGEGTERRDRLLCRLLVTAADFYIQIGEFDQATACLEAALEISSRENWPDMRAEAEQTKGDLFYNEGKFIQASAVLQDAIAYFESANDRLHLAESYYKLGICFRRSERWQDTAQILTRALNISQALSYNWAVVICLWALGYLYRTHGQQELSLEYHEKSIQLALDINFIPGVYRGYVSAGNSYEDLGNYEKALECFELSVKYAQETGDQSGLIRANGSIARLFWKLNRPMEALELINETLPLTRRLGFKVHIAWQLIVKAEILFTLGQYKEAWPVNEEGLMLARETTSTDRILQGEILAIRLQVALGQRERALNKLNEMLETAEDVFTLAAAHYELWQLTGEEWNGRQALENYRLAYERDPYIGYKERIERLEKLNG